MQMVKRDIAIISTQRSGTQYLSTLLSSHEDIVAIKEIFNPTSPNNFMSFAKEEIGRVDSPFNDDDSDIFITLYNSYIQSKKPLSKQIIFVGMYNHLERIIKFDIKLFLRDLSIVHLIRRNVLRTHISDQINRTRLKPSHNMNKEEGDKLVRIKIPTDSILQQLRARLEHIDVFRNTLRQLDCAEIYYEDLVTDPDMLNGILENFGYRSGKLSTRLKPSNPYPLSEIIENFDAVKEALGGSEFEEFVFE